MSNIGPLELIFVLVIALVFLGPKRLPAAAKSLGRSISEFRHGLADQTGERSATPERPDAEITQERAPTWATTLAPSAAPPATDPDRNQVR